MYSVFFIPIFQNVLLRDQINISNETISPTSIDPHQVNNRIQFFRYFNMIIILE